jgi:hypothetical protein
MAGAGADDRGSVRGDGRGAGIFLDGLGGIILRAWLLGLVLTFGFCCGGLRC